MHDATGYVLLFHGLAVIELFAVAAFQALLPAPRHARINWIADDPHWDFAESYDEAA